MESETVLVDDLLLGSGQDFWENLLVTSSREDTATLGGAELSGRTQPLLVELRCQGGHSHSWWSCAVDLG